MSSDPSSLTFLAVALIAATPPTLAVLAKWRSDKRRNSEHDAWLERNVGRSNGQGTVVQMLENAIQWQGEHQAEDRATAKELRAGQARLEELITAK